MLDLIAQAGLGDARKAFNLLERSLVLARAKGRTAVDEATVQEAAQRKLVLYDKQADAHYDVISAFIKSLRGSDPDAALYYLAVMLTGGEDPKFIARRMIIFASEDIGNADPRALEVAIAVSRAVEFVGHAGMPHQPGPRGHLSRAARPSPTPRTRASTRPWPRWSSTGPRLRRSFCAAPAIRGPRRWATGWATSTRTTTGATTPSAICPRSSPGMEFYQPTENGFEARIKEFLGRLRNLRKGGAQDRRG